MMQGRKNIKLLPYSLLLGIASSSNTYSGPYPPVYTTSHIKTACLHLLFLLTALTVSRWRDGSLFSYKIWKYCLNNIYRNFRCSCLYSCDVTAVFCVLWCCRKNDKARDLAEGSTKIMKMIYCHHYHHHHYRSRRRCKLRRFMRLLTVSTNPKMVFFSPILSSYNKLGKGDVTIS